jgi:hypothetical protein
MKRALAMLVLPASILPVFLTGPALLRAPEGLWRQISADVRGAPGPSASHQHGVGGRR